MSIKEAIAASGTGARIGKLEEVGNTLVGVVISAELRQARDDDNKPDFWEDGNPKQQLVVLLQTALDEGPNENGKEDDGRRTHYTKWWGEQKKAFMAAIRLAEADDLYPGDTYKVKYIGDGEKVKKQWSAPKLLKYKIEPKPKSAGLADDFDAEPEVEVVKPAAAARKPIPQVDAAKKLADAGIDADDF